MSIFCNVPTLEDLPPAPADKSGWPWTEQSQPLADRMFDGSEWPRISIITPSYNYGQFLEETIRSVLLQGYPNLEYIIIDGGSADYSIEIIKRYEPWLYHWVTEPDNGQTDAIVKGFNISSGVIWNWINADDLLEKNALRSIAIAYSGSPSATLFFGELIFFGSRKKYLMKKYFKEFSELVCIWETWPCIQPAIFMSSNACRQVDGFDPSLHYIMDYYLYTQLTLLPEFVFCMVDLPTARFRKHSSSKTGSQTFATLSEILVVFDKLAAKHQKLLPQGWSKSRSRFTYHIALAAVIDSTESGISLFSFLEISMPFLSVLWNYRFFWSVLIKTILGFNPLKTNKDM